jgi:hypothetical protein
MILVDRDGPIRQAVAAAEASLCDGLVEVDG